MTKLLQWLGWAPSDEERAIFNQLSRRESASMKVVGRGTLTNNVRSVRSTPKVRKLIKEMNGE